MSTLEARFEEISGLTVLIGLFSMFVFALMIAEFFWDRKNGYDRSWAESGANLGVGAGNALLNWAILSSIFLTALYLVEQFAFVKIGWSWYSWILSIVVADLSYYWMHRIEHQVRFFWSFHSVHHSSPEFNLTTGIRLAWVENLFEWMFLVPMVLMGFDVVQTVASFMVVATYQAWIHTDKIGSLGWLDVVFNTPSPHRVHHGRDQKYRDKNYGGILLIWDHIFGTYQKEEETPEYGLVHQLRSSNPFVINFHESWMIAKDVLHARSLKDTLRYVLGRPGWKPDESQGATSLVD